MLLLITSLLATYFALKAVQNHIEMDAKEFELECSNRRCEGLVRRMKDAN